MIAVAQTIDDPARLNLQIGCLSVAVENADVREKRFRRPFPVIFLVNFTIRLFVDRGSGMCCRTGVVVRQNLLVAFAGNEQ